MVKNKETIRQCISCRSQTLRENLIRFTKVTNPVNSGNRIVISTNKHQFGRSAYICKKSSCIQVAIKEKKIAKMLRISVNLINQSLINELNNYIPKEREGIPA